MKKLLCIAIAILILAASLSAGFTALAASAGQYIVDDEDGVELYKIASAASSVLCVIRENTIITVTDVVGSFGKVKYDGYTGWVRLTSVTEYTAKNPNISKITVTQKPDKISYYDNETFDATGLEVTAHYTNGTTKIVSAYIYSPTFETEGKKTVKVMYEGHYASFTVTVNRMPIDRIEITTLPDTTEVKEGLELDLTGMVVTVYYTDGRDSHAVSDYTISGYKPNKTGKQTVTVTYRYDDITTTLNITVIPKILQKIEITTLPNKLDYYGLDRNIDLTGLVLTASYDNGTTKMVTPDSAVCEDMKLGKNTVTLTVEDKTATYDITLHELKITGFYVTEPTTTGYLKGTQPDWSGLSIYYEYNSGAKKYITAGYKISEPDMNILGVHAVTVSHGDYSTSFNITVYGTNLLGDIDFNGKVEVKEARIILRAAVGIDELAAEQIHACGLESGQKPTTSIARQVLRIAVSIDEVKYLF